MTLALPACTGVLRHQIEPGQPTTQLAIANSGGPSSSALIRLGEIRGTRGCRLQYLLYAPTAKANAADPLVVLGHGFLRSFEHMDQHARSLAAAGYRVASVRFCNSSIWDGRHQANGHDMVAIADALGAQRVAYVGFSAGGLAALIAAREDPRALGVVALDLVDRNGIGLTAARELDRPLIGLVGPPSECNAGSNGLPVLAANRHSQIHRFPEASHCDFEAPTDWLCRRICGERPGSAQRRRQILQATTTAVASLCPARDQNGARR